jgi:hypothetical protein
MRQIKGIVGLSAGAQADIIASFPACASQVTRHDHPYTFALTPDLEGEQPTPPCSHHHIYKDTSIYIFLARDKPRSLVRTTLTALHLQHTLPHLVCLAALGTVALQSKRRDWAEHTSPTEPPHPDSDVRPIERCQS